MRDDSVLVWEQSDKEANQILQRLQATASYPWVWRKLRSARFHLIERRTFEVPYTNQDFVTNGDAE